MKLRIRRRSAPTILADPVLDRRLAADGWVTTRITSAATAAGLRDRFLELRGEGGPGFEADLTNPDTAYRRRVAELGTATIGATVVDRFVDHEPFLWSFLCKWPGEVEDFYLHRDWWFVDERAGARSYLVWLALQDIGPDNGPLLVLPNSHLLDTEPTGTHLAPSWLGQAKTLDDRLRTVHVRAGEAVIMNHALVHGSLRNLTSDPRVVLGCAVHGRNAPLVHFRRADRSSAVRYEVDPSFFVTETPQGLMADPPDLVPAETLADDADRTYPHDLRARLDAGGRR